MIDDEPDILSNYMELVVQFGFVSLFGTVFPIGAAVSYVSNHVQIVSQIDALKYTRRSRAEPSIGIGTWIDCISCLTQLSIITNAAQIYFTSSIYKKMFVIDNNDDYHELHENIHHNIALTLVQFLIFVVLLEHILLILKTFIEQTIDDTPDFVVTGERERDSILENEIAEMKLNIDPDKKKYIAKAK